MNKKGLLWGAIGLVVLGFAFYAISPLFRTVEVQDELPDNIIVDNNAGASRAILSDVPSGLDDLTEEEQAEMDEQMISANERGPIVMEESMPDTTETSEEPQLASADPNVTFPVMHTVAHPAEGDVRVVPTTDGTIVRFENYKTINGPNLHIYLAKDLDAEEFIDLGPIRGTEGNINYTVPEGVDVSEYQYVMVWCVPFGVLFNFAEINPLSSSSE